MADWVVFRCHMFYEQRLLDIPDGLPKWAGMQKKSELIGDSPPEEIKKRKREMEEEEEEETEEDGEKDEKKDGKKGKKPAKKNGKA